MVPRYSTVRCILMSGHLLFHGCVYVGTLPMGHGARTHLLLAGPVTCAREIHIDAGPATAGHRPPATKMRAIRDYADSTKILLQGAGYVLRLYAMSRESRSNCQPQPSRRPVHYAAIAHVYLALSCASWPLSPLTIYTSPSLSPTAFSGHRRYLFESLTLVSIPPPSPPIVDTYSNDQSPVPGVLAVALRNGYEFSLAGLVARVLMESLAFYLRQLGERKIYPGC